MWFWRFLREHRWKFHTALLTAGIAAGAGLAAALSALRVVQRSVGLAPPTREQLEEEQPETRSPLFRLLPEMAQRLAWRQLGDGFPTPVHCAQVALSDDVNAAEAPWTFFVKREDLSSKLGKLLANCWQTFANCFEDRLRYNRTRAQEQCQVCQLSVGSARPAAGGRGLRGWADIGRAPRSVEGVPQRQREPGVPASQKLSQK